MLNKNHSFDMNKSFKIYSLIIKLQNIFEPSILISISICEFYFQNVCCESNEEHHKQKRSSSASKTPNSPDSYFPDIEYPKDILDVAKPFYFQAPDAVLEPFSRDVKESFKSISSGGETVVKPVRKTARPILKTGSNVLSAWSRKHKNNTVSLNKTNSTSVLLENKHVNPVGEIELDNANISSTENNSTEYFDSQEIEDILTLYATNFTFNSQEIAEESQGEETRLSTTNVSSNSHEITEAFIEEDTSPSATNVTPSSEVIVEDSQEKETNLATTNISSNSQEIGEELLQEKESSSSATNVAPSSQIIIKESQEVV